MKTLYPRVRMAVAPPPPQRHDVVLILVLHMHNLKPLRSLSSSKRRVTPSEERIGSCLLWAFMGTGDTRGGPIPAVLCRLGEIKQNGNNIQQLSHRAGSILLRRRCF